MMDRIKRLSINQPLAFSFLVTFVFILMVIVSSIVVGAIWPADTYGWYIGSTISRAVSIFILLVMLSRLGWYRSAGFTRAGPLQTWLILLLPLAYTITASAFAFTGNFDFSFTNPWLVGTAGLFLLTHAFLEETAFRGLIMHNLVRMWGSTRRGLTKSILVSSLFFGVMHVIYIFSGESLPVVLLRTVTAFLLGITLGVLVLHGGSIYPAVFFHGVLNFAGFLNLTSNAAEGTTESWLYLSLFMVPLAIFGLYLQSTAWRRGVKRVLPT